MLAVQQYSKGVAITPSDSVNFTKQGTSDDLSSAIYIGGAGVLAVVFQDGSVVNFTVIAGQVLHVRAKRINSTNTTATLLVALYAL